jgi:hypothetical protein
MQPSFELSKIIAAWFESVEKGDISWVDRHVSRKAETRLVGTDPNEVLSGQQAADFLKEEVRAMGNVVKATVGEVEAYQEGSIGWGLARPTLTLPDGTQIFPRWSAVFNREDDEWKLVQLHASVGISNEQLLDMEPSG